MLERHAARRAARVADGPPRDRGVRAPRRRSSRRRRCSRRPAAASKAGDLGGGGRAGWHLPVDRGAADARARACARVPAGVARARAPARAGRPSDRRAATSRRSPCSTARARGPSRSSRPSDQKQLDKQLDDARDRTRTGQRLDRLRARPRLGLVRHAKQRLDGTPWFRSAERRRQLHLRRLGTVVAAPARRPGARRRAATQPQGATPSIRSPRDPGPTRSLQPRSRRRVVFASLSFAARARRTASASATATWPPPHPARCVLFARRACPAAAVTLFTKGGDAASCAAYRRRAGARSRRWRRHRRWRSP